MGNLALCMVGGSKAKPINKMLQVMKMNDGKLLKFRMSMKVNDLLLNYPNSYVGLFKEATQPLPLDYKLKIGKKYYLFPPPCNNIIINAKNTSTPPKPKNGATRIKVVITRQQLNQFLSNQVRVEPVLMDIDTNNQCSNLVDLSLGRLQKLDSIPE